MTLLQKNKILRIIGFGIYLLLGFFAPLFLLLLWEEFYLTLNLPKNYAFFSGLIYLIIGHFSHYKFRNLAKQIGMINKKRKEGLENFLTFLAFSYWLTLSLGMFIEWMDFNSIIT